MTGGGAADAPDGADPAALDPAVALDLAAVRARWPAHEHLLDELAAAVLDDLPYAQAVLALLIAPGDPAVRLAAAGPNPDSAALLRALAGAPGPTPGSDSAPP